MDISEIKKIIEADGGKFIFVEDGKPTMVVCSFDEYKKKLFKEASSVRPASIPKELSGDELKIEDLPL
ncbi:MAG: hypothetical protein HYT21_00695 [Candidatus Nealsonbacteria bacterium]|nr:hypothetical protein [Candidatus Nealsonbacteria bacterium]